MNRPASLVLIALLWGAGPGCAKNVTGVDRVDGAGLADTQTRRGTVDGGGGAGFRGQPLETYARDIKTFPEYKALVAPVLQNVARIHADYGKVFEHIVDDRLWLFIDAPVPKISAERQGLLYNFDQWAVQNAKEIWMSDEYKGDDSARARILIHEILVGLKIMRFLSYNEYCYAWTSDRKSCDPSANEVLIPDYKLTALDHEDVRKMTDWLLANAAVMTPAQFGHQMHVLQFQGPHFSWKQGLSAGPARPMNSTIEAVAKRPTKRLWTNFGPTGEAAQTCDLTMNLGDQNGLNIDVKIADVKSGKDVRAIKVRALYDPKVPRVAAPDSYESGEITQSFDDGRPMKKVGDRQSVVSLAFEDERLTSLYLGESRVESARDGSTSSKTNTEGPGGVSCEQYPFTLPSEYNRWLEMRQTDREFLERHRFGGQTVEQLQKKYLNELMIPGG